MLYPILFFAMLIVSYFIGNVNNAIIISKLKKNDIRKLGSGNPGTMNMSRNFGLKIGLLTLFLDALKGAIPSLIGYFLFKGVPIFTDAPYYFYFEDLAKYAFGLMAVIGHIFPVIYKFKGGKGIATTIGTLLVCSITSGWPWVIAVMAGVAAIVFIYVTEFGAMGSFIAITPPAVANVIYLFLKYNTYDTQIRSVNVFYIVSCLIIALMCFITWLAHRKNIERMLKGEEHHTSIKTMIFNHKMKKREKAKQKEIQKESESFSNQE